MRSNRSGWGSCHRSTWSTGSRPESGSWGRRRWRRDWCSAPGSTSSWTLAGFRVLFRSVAMDENKVFIHFGFVHKFYDNKKEQGVQGLAVRGNEFLNYVECEQQNCKYQVQECNVSMEVHSFKLVCEMTKPQIVKSHLVRVACNLVLKGSRRSNNVNIWWRHFWMSIFQMKTFRVLTLNFKAVIVNRIRNNSDLIWICKSFGKLNLILRENTERNHLNVWNSRKICWRQIHGLNFFEY